MLLTIIFLLPILSVHSIYSAPVEPEYEIKEMTKIPRISNKFGIHKRKLLEHAFKDVTLLVESVLYGDRQVVDTVYFQYFDFVDAPTVFGERGFVLGSWPNLS